MGVDQRRHDRLAREIDVRGVGGRPKLAATSDLREPAVNDDECGVFDRRAAVPVDEPRAFVDSRARVAALTRP